MRKHIKFITYSTTALMPMLAMAQGSDVKFVFDRFLQLINGFVIPAVFAVAGLVFLWGVFRYITSAGDEEKRTEGQKYIVWGLVGLAVMIAFWGLVNALATFFGFGSGPSLQNIPQFPGTR